MSTFVPRNKLIRNQLILNPLQNLIKNYIVNYSINDNQYNIEIEKVLEKETMIFLAYMCCDKKTKSILSKIWTSLESTNHSNIKHPYILPYHTKTISFRASGIWINKNLFFIQRIDNPKPPNDMKVKVKCYKTIGKNEDFKNNEIGELDDEKQFSTPINQNKINETTKITAKKNPSRTSGIKYIVSEVSPDNNDIDCDIDEEITIVDNNSFDNDELTIDDIINIRIENAIDENLIELPTENIKEPNAKFYKTELDAETALVAIFSII